MFKSVIFSFGFTSRTSGAHRIATELRQHDWDCEVVDFVLWWEIEELKSFAETRIDSNTRFVGFSHLFYTWNPMLEHFCEWLKARWPHLYIFTGSNAWPSIKSDYIDYYFQGYSEHAVLALCKQLFSNGDPVEYTVDHGRKVILANVNYIAAPYKEPLIIYEDRDYICPEEWLAIEFSRGCKFKCDFCNFPMLGVKGDYSRNADSVERQLKDAHDRFGVTRYVVTDETFNDRLEKINKFADVVENLDFDPLFTGFLRADLLVSKPAQQEALLRMGFIGHYYGIESFNHKTAKIVGKGMHPERLQQGLIDIKDYFLKHGPYKGEISLIVGLPHETESSIRSTKRWLLENWKGQRFQPFAMDIPKQHHDKNSLISLDYNKYGYVEMSPEEIASKKIPPRLYYDSSPFASTFPENVVWKNKNMDVFDAITLTNELSVLSKTKKFTIGAFRLGQVGLPQELNKLLNLSVIEADNIEEIENVRVLNEYKTKKIG
jgi:hypothetical protein